MDLKSKQMKNALFLISFAIILLWALDNIINIVAIVDKFLDMISPFIIGFAIAFILNGPMKFIERNLFGNKGIFKNIKDSFKRPLSYMITLLLFLVVIFIILFIVVPELINTIEDLGEKIPSYIDRLEKFADVNLANNPQVIEWINNMEWKSIEKSIISFLKTSGLNWIGSTFAFASSVVGGIISFALAFVFSIYALLQKEQLLTQAKKVILAYLPEKIASKIFYIGNLSNQIFSSFLSGQLLEAIIIGGLFFISMSILRFPYALLISLVIGVMSLIPIFGSFIGCFIGTFLIMVVDVKMAFWFLIMFIIIQQIEGNLIYPHVVGKASGLPSIWILVAVSLGGSIMGVLGIILFIPIFSVLYTLLRESVNSRLKFKNIKEVE